MDDLTPLFLKNGIDQDELIQFLSWGWDSTTNEKGNYLYGYCIEVECSKEHRILKIRGDLKNAQVSNKIAQFEQAFSESGLDIGMRVGYSKIPVHGFYRYKNVFQILPVPEVREETYFSVYPFLIQFSYNKSSSRGVGIHRESIKSHEVVHLLSTLLKFGITQPTNEQTFSLIMDDDENKFSDFNRNRYVQLSYSPGSKSLENIKIDEIGFYQIDEYSELGRENPNDYFDPLGLGINDEMCLPANFELLLDSYYLLTKADRETFIRSAYWLTKSRQIFSVSKSASYVCLVQGLEALIGKSAPLYEKCPKDDCESLIKSEKGPTALFKSFIDTFAPGLPNGIKNNLYSIRSSIAHGNRLLDSDVGFTSFGQKSSTEMEQYRLMSRVVVICQINWLHHKHESKNPAFVN